MLKVLLRLLGIIVAGLVVLAIIGWLLPRGFETKVEQVVNAPPERIFPLINRLENWQQWSPWSPQVLAELKMEYQGPAEGVGAIQSWKDPRGSGKLWIVGNEVNRSIDYQMSFTDFPTSTGRITLTPTDAGTQVEWTTSGELRPGALNGWLGRLFFEPGMENEYRKSLEQLKLVAESDERADR